jgi:GTP:adenosylcobinamide-phosphate guanylyltransferase
MDAVVSAGGIPLPEEPLYPETKGESKALLDVAGKPMVQWVLDALSGSKMIDNVIIVGLTEKLGLKCAKKMYFISNQGKMLDNMRAGAEKIHELDPKAEYLLFVSSDIPAITGEMVDWVVNTAMETKEDVYYNVIQRDVMEKRFPGSKRTYTKLKDMEVCGGDMNVGRLNLILSDENPLWERITDSRKSPIKQAGLIGLNTIIPLLFRQLTLEQAASNIMKRFEITGRGVVCPYAEVGMDIDKPHQLEILRADLKKQIKKAQKVASKGKTAARKPIAKKTAQE